MSTTRLPVPYSWLIAVIAVLFCGNLSAQLADITQPGDPIVPTSNNSPGSEGVANAIDNQPTKYLNFDKLNTGFTVTPRVGLSVVQCITLTSANDAPERDPASYVLSGSYDGTNFTQIASGTVPAFPSRFFKQTIQFPNNTPYLTYRLIFPTVANEAAANSMQISEVELLGFLAPTDVTQPGDPIVATSNNSPGSEGVANSIDNQPTKYLNFDKLNTGFTVTPGVGGTLVSGITLTSANDAPERDPASYQLEGSLDGTSFFPISSGPVPAFPARFSKTYIFFTNARAYKAYRLIFPTVANAAAANSMQISEVELLGVVSDLPQDVTQPGDPIVASSNNSPGSEGVANAIDNQPTKYLNFDKLNTGFTVSPRAGLTVVSGLTLTSANDAPERDPASYVLSGAYDGSNFTQIATGTIAPFTARFQKTTILFDNKIPYLQYRLVFPTVANEAAANSMQISEVELLGVLAPTDVTVPGDAIVATSNNSPGSEGVANSIDNQPTKYLNFDKLNTGFTVTPGVGDTIVIGLSLTSANDAPERDPASFTLTGSNDGSNFVDVASGPVPPFPTRFYKSYIFFPNNTKSFKSYRLIFPTVANAAAANSMQISEVEFLGVTPGVVNTNEVETLIRRQPSDTPVLLGQTATFRVGLTGPWKVQWYKNGVRIPGANNTSYTTPPATAADDGATFYAIVQSPQGVQKSDEVMLSIFRPSTTKSIGLSWVGGGANGAPTAMLPTDITGFQPQAYWNNLVGGSGTLAAPTNSDNGVSSEITVTWTTSGEWGVGTGNSDATERMLNGMVTSFSTTEAAAQTVTLSGVPAGSHSIFLYTVQVPQEFFNMDFAVVTHDAGGAEVIQRRYIRPQNADEYNPSPGFSLVTADTAAAREVGNMMRFDNLVPGSDGTIQIRFFSPGRVDLPGGDPIRGPGLNGMQLVLNPVPAGDAPTITRQPVSANAIVGGQVTLLVEATGPNLSYQWLKNGQRIEGATSAELTLSNVQTNDAGNYNVIVSNPAGRVASRTAVVGVVASGQVAFGLITYLKLDNGGADGVTLSNSVTGGQAGRVQGGLPDFQPGQVGSAFALNGVDNYGLVPNYPKVSRAMTAAGWITTFTGEGPIVNNWVEGQTTGASGQFLVDLIHVDGIPTVRAQIEVGPNRVLASAPLDATQSDAFVFHHFAMSANGVNLSLYWDGQLLTTVDYLGNINSTPSIPWLAIGANLGAGDPPPLTGAPLFGLLDEIALWNRSLSEVEVQGIYAGGLSGKMLTEIPPILNINRSPIAVADTASTSPGTAVLVNVLANDSDPDAGDVLSLTSVTAPAHGTATVSTNDLVLYTPASGFTGQDQFTYRISDGHGGIASATVTVSVLDNIPPIVNCPGDITTAATSPAGAVVNYVASAVDAGGLRDFTCVPPTGSTFPIGQTTVTCTAVDLATNTASCSFKVTVTSGNEAPIARNDTAVTQVNTPVTINVLANDSDPDGDPLTLTTTSSAAHGVLSLVPAGLVLYTPNPGYIGPDSFTYQISDGHGGSATATVTVTVNPANLPPVADASATERTVISGNNSNAVVHLDGSRSSDPDGDALTYSWLVDGGVVPVATGAIADIVLEVGTHTITLVVDDGLASDSDVIQVNVITAAEAIDEIIAVLNAADLERKNKRPLIASLKAASASFDRGNTTSGANQLNAFLNKLGPQVGRTDPVAAEALRRAVQKVLDAVE
jgi:hypothetical protein